MPKVQMGKFKKNTLTMAILSSSVFLSACTLDDSSNSAPAFSEAPVSTTVLTVGEQYNDQLMATDADGDVLHFSSPDKPKWLEMVQTGKLSSAVLKDSHIGTYNVTFQAADSEDAAFTTVQYQILNSVPTAPKLAAESTTLFTDTSFSANLTATDSGETPLSFEIVSATLNGEATQWLSIVLNQESGQYQLIGTPTEADAGETVVVVAVTDGMDTVESTFIITAEVPPPNEAPGAPTLDVTTATEAVAFSAKVSATDAENDILTYTLDVNSPEWLTLDENTGDLTGTPGTTDVGQNDIFVIVSDGINTNAAQTVTVTVAGTAPSDLVITNNDGATEDALFSANLSATEDTLDDLLTYSIEAGPAWLSVDAASGDLSGTPALADLNTNTFTARVTDLNGNFVELTFDIEVAAKPVVNVAPEFVADIIFKPADGQDSDYALATQSIATSASDNNGDTLTFTKVAGPDWLQIAADGTLSGTVDLTEENSFTVEVSDGALTDTATLNITKATINAEKLTTSSQAVGRAFSAQLNGENGFGSQDTLTYTEIAGDSANLFEISPQGLITSAVLTAADIGAHEVQFQVTNGVQTTATPDLGGNLTVLINVMAVNAVTGNTDSFSDVATTFDEWANESGKSLLQAPTTGGNPGGMMRIKSGARAIKYYDTSGFTSVSLSFDRLLANLVDAEDEMYSAEWSSDGVNWTVLESLNNDTEESAKNWTSKSFTLTGAEGHEIIAIRFNSTGINNVSQARIDNVSISGTP
ncbi:putative Ig domain-containing protein [Thalassotalea sp. PLHSN55]|uniref:putative Ig domain-containing protein n=1 Tax=Thalassotalea sp. PLHSN55 TaxID=3435888 RepID=UPI003F833DFE